MILASFQSQYGIRLSTELDKMKWSEFSALLVGIDPKTPLGRIVSIRAENRKDVIQKFTPDEKRIWNEWRKKRRDKIPETEQGDYQKQMEELQKQIVSMLQ